MSCLCVRRLKWTAVSVFVLDKPHAGHPGQPYVARHCEHVAHTPTWQKKTTSSKNQIFSTGMSTASSGPTQRAEQLPQISSQNGRGEDVFENLERRTCDPKRDAIVLLPCPSRVRIDVHGAVVDCFHIATVVWQWWTWRVFACWS